MDAAGIAALITAGTAPPTGSSDIGFHTGQIVSWDESSGTNVVTVQGVNLSNLKALQGGIGVLYQAGDVVGIIRFQTTYFVLGKVAAPGAGAASQIKTANVVTGELANTTNAWADLATVGPTISNFYVGSSRRVLMLFSVNVVSNCGYGYMGVQVSGASTMSPGTPAGTSIGSGHSITGQYTSNTVTGVRVYTAADGLNQGFHTFQAKYQGPGPISTTMSNRSIVLIPF
jgi:hypothetical protein